MRIKLPGSKKTFHIGQSWLVGTSPDGSTKARYLSWMLHTSYDDGRTVSSAFGLVASPALDLRPEDVAVIDADDTDDQPESDVPSVDEDPAPVEVSQPTEPSISDDTDSSIDKLTACKDDQPTDLEAELDAYAESLISNPSDLS